MGFWDAVVLIVLIAAVARVRIARHGGSLTTDWRRGESMIGTGQVDSRIAADIADLSRRIAVLERIATENRSQRDIAAEIEALRD
ncbi:MAG: hypothetical protein KGN34_14165 [Sphingomonadales bacterium]|nr:hypothetical protein [Sphingomonadales bacterium]